MRKHFHSKTCCWASPSIELIVNGFLVPVPTARSAVPGLAKCEVHQISRASGYDPRVNRVYLKVEGREYRSRVKVESRRQKVESQAQKSS